MDPFTLAAGSALIGGGLSYLGARENTQGMIEANEANIAMTYDLANTGIQRRVEDATAAGINPLFALGAPTMSPTVPIQNTNPGAGLQHLGQTFSQGAALALNQPGTLDTQIKLMNTELLKHQLAEAEKSNQMPPLFIEAYDPNPNSPTYRGKVWVFNPDLETEGITSFVGTTYSNGVDAVKGLEKQITSKLGKGYKNAKVINSKKLDILREIKRRYSIPEKIKARASKFFNWITE